MKEISLQTSLLSEIKASSRTALEIQLERWNLILFISAVLGGFCGLAGVTISTLSLAGVLIDHPRIDHTGTALLVLAFPLAILAAHCIDRGHEVEKKIVIEYCRRTGMTDFDHQSEQNDK